MPKGSSGDDGEDRAPAGDALQEPAGVARQENPLERQARELASKGYSQYTIALLMGTRPTEVSSLLGVIQPSGKGSARKRERPEQAARPVVPIESIVHEPRGKPPERPDSARPRPEHLEPSDAVDQARPPAEAQQDGPVPASDLDDIWYEPDWDLWYNPDWDVGGGKETRGPPAARAPAGTDRGTVSPKPEEEEEEPTGDLGVSLDSVTVDPESPEAAGGNEQEHPPQDGRRDRARREFQQWFMAQQWRLREEPRQAEGQHQAEEQRRGEEQRRAEERRLKAEEELEQEREREQTRRLAQRWLMEQQRRLREARPVEELPEAAEQRESEEERQPEERHHPEVQRPSEESDLSEDADREERRRRLQEWLMAQQWQVREKTQEKRRQAADWPRNGERDLDQDRHRAENRRRAQQWFVIQQWQARERRRGGGRRFNGGRRGNGAQPEEVLEDYAAAQLERFRQHQRRHHQRYWKSY